MNRWIAIWACAWTACSSGTSGDDSKDGETPGGAQGATCDEVCNALEDLCGPLPPGCDEGCETLSADVRACVVDAGSCQAADACGTSDTDTDTDADSDSDADADTDTDADTDADGDRCSNGYLLGTAICTGYSFNVVQGCRETDGGTLVSFELACGGDTPVCLSESSGDETTTDDDVAGCCPLDVSFYDEDRCIGF